VITIKATGVADRTVATNQEAKPEFLSISDLSVSKSGGSITVTGTSNSQRLTFTLGDGTIVSGLSANFLAGGSSSTSGVDISGDPGEMAQYAFSMTLTATANVTTSGKTQTVTVTAKGGQSAQATLSQAAGDPVLTVSPTSITINAAGDPVSITVTSNTNWTVE
jgi:hypothetical protein